MGVAIADQKIVSSFPPTYQTDHRRKRFIAFELWVMRLEKLWVMGTANQLGKRNILRVRLGYGFSEVWVRRGSTANQILKEKKREDS